MSHNCIFCKILAGEIPSFKVGETDATISILDAFPMSSGHVLILSKEHFEKFHDIPAPVQKEMMVEAGRLARLLVDRLGLHDYNVLLNSGVSAGQTVPHAHLHVIPRREGDRVISFTHGEKRDAAYYDDLKSKLLS